MMQLDEHNNVKDYTIVLSRQNHTHLGQLKNVDKTSVVNRINMNGANELSFIVYKYDNGVKEPLWDEIVDFKFVWVQELNEYYQIIVEINEEECDYKAITATSACECELSQIIINRTEINTELDIARQEYKSPTVFYDPLKPECSLLHRTLEKAPHYSIKHVDSSLNRIQRTFSIDGTSIYDFYVGELAQEIGCLFTFDTVDRSISVFDLKTVCIDCGHRGEFYDKCPKCNSTNLKYFGHDTTVFVDKENLAEGINFVTDTEKVKNCFRLEAGDADMTAAVINRNPNGSNYIYYFSEEAKREMSPALVKRLEEYDKAMASYDKEYGTLMDSIYTAIEKIVYYKSSMMPKREDTPTDAKKEAAKLTELNLSPLGLPNVIPTTSTATVNTALKAYSKVFIKSGWFKVDVVEGDFSYAGADSRPNTSYGYWNGILKVTNYSDPEDTATTPRLVIKVTNDYEAFLQQKIDKKIANDSKDEGSIFDVLSIKDLTAFKQALTLYGLARLTSFYDSLQGCIDIMIESGQANDNSELYTNFYVPYYDKLQACQAEIDKRKQTITEWETKLETAQKRQKEIQKALHFETFLGRELFLEFCLYRREDTYSNSNYVSNGLENNEIFENAKTFLDVAKEELVKSGEYQHVLTANLINLFAIKEFEPIKSYLKLGNFLRVKCDDKIYRLRLVSYEVSFEDIGKIEVEFADVTKTKNGATDMQSILSKAQSMATSYGAVANQVKSSKDQTDMVKDFVNRGLDATAVKIVNNAENQNITIGETGLLARQKEDFTNEYSPFQLKLLSNGLYFTDDGFKSVRSAFGKYIYVDPKTGQQSVKYGILADSIIGQLILGNQIELYSNDDTAEMKFNDQGLVLNTKKNKNGQYKRIFDVQKDGTSIFYVDNQGNLVFAQDQFIQMIEKLDRVVVKYLDADNLHANTGNIVRLESAYGKIDEISSTKGTITNLTTTTLEGVSGHFTGDLKTDTELIAAAAQIQQLNAVKGTIGELDSTTAVLQNLSSTLASITTLNAGEIKADKLNISAVDFTNIHAITGVIETLTSAIATINDLTAPLAKITNLSVSTKADIEYVVSNAASIKKIVSDLGEFTTLKANVATLQKAIVPLLEATDATVNNLNATIATIPTLNSTNIIVDKITANTADIKQLNAVIGSYEELKALVANIESILAGNIGTGLLQTIHLTAKNVVIDDAVIRELIASKISVSDLKAGSISTDKFTIQSDDGGIVLKGATQQFRDNQNNVRLQMGKDAQGNFNFSVFDASGKGKIFDQDGIKEAGIPNQIIKNDMVADNAGITGNKLNIDSVVTSINNGTTTINSNKVWVDSENQSLGASFTQIKDNLNDTIKTITPYFVLSKSNTMPPLNGWTEVLPTKGKDDYIWRKDLIIKTDGTQTWTQPICVTGNDGKDGNSINIKGSYSSQEWEAIKPSLIPTAKAGDCYMVEGRLMVFDGKDFIDGGNIKGEAGNGVSSSTVSYQIGANGIDIPTGAWSSTIPNAPEGSYLWTKTTILYTDGRETVMYSVSYIGINGLNGRQYELDIVSSNGNVFKNGNINTTLSAILYEYGTVSTDKYNDNMFIWTRVSNDVQGDNIWNSEHAGGTKQIQITGNDVRARATFYCDFIDTTTRTSLL